MTTPRPLSRADFGAFFTAVRGYPPFAWQERLLDRVLHDGQWPQAIAAPTGAGKTAVVDVHVFANALAAVGAGPRVPRRLAVVVNRRMLVDSHDQYAGRLAEELHEGESEVVAAVAAALRSLVPPPLSGEPQPALLRTVLRGGVERDTAWRIQPEACAVLTCTPDMWGSRLLLRGYGTSRRARPQEAGLLALDSVVVVDEAHLTQQLVMTARRVAALTSRDGDAMGIPTLQVVDTTATPRDGGTADVVAVEAADLDLSETLRERLTRPKPVRLLELPEWPAKTGPSREAMAAAVAKAIAELRAEVASVERAAGRTLTIGCVLNRVDDATAVAARLEAEGLRVTLLTGRMRPFDRARLSAAHPGLLSTVGTDDVDVLVATQTIEVGVDVDLAALVTDLAPGSALAQRAGRVNRLGQRASGPVVVITPTSGIDRDAERSRGARSPLYTLEELCDALAWLTPLVGTEQGVAPWVLSTEHRPPAASRRRLHLQRLSVSDVTALARTSEAGHAEIDLSFWLDDELEADVAVSVVFRRLTTSMALPTTESVVTLLGHTRPEEHEVVNLRFAALRQLVSSYLAAGRQRHAVAPLHRYRAAHGVDEPPVVSLAVPDSAEEDVAGIALRGTRPGDVVILDAGLLEAAGLAAWSWRAAGLGASSRDVDVYDLSVDQLRDQQLQDQGTDDEPRWSGRLRIGHLSHLDGPAYLDAVAAYRGDEDDPARAGNDDVTEAGRRADLAAALSDADESDGRWASTLAEVQEVLLGGVRGAEVVVSDRDDPLQYLVITRQNEKTLDAETLSTAGSGRLVTLDEHQRAVGARAAASAATLGLPDSVVSALATAGEHHDDGKNDTRFQVERLGAATGGAPLAKSGPMISAELRRRFARSSLPRGWRHEQLSALHAQAALRSDEGADVDRQLVVRLVGTSHGVGRPSFPHAALDLLPPSPDGPTPQAVDLFDEGGWEALVEATDARYGVWTVAYLEALLRAADIRVSQEGS